jgi:hypothetical protein
MFAYVGDNGTVQDFAHVFNSYDLADLLDDIASADPPAYLRRCFAEGLAATQLSWSRVQQLAGCALVVDAVADTREYEGLEPELLADWRLHFATPFAALKAPAVAVLQRIVAANPPLAVVQSEAAAELAELQRRLAPN